MTTAIRMPDVGTTVEQITLVEWLKKEGETVKRADPLCVVQTDKVTVEIESIAEGILLRHQFTTGTEIREGTTIAYIGRAGETRWDTGVF